MPRNFAVRLQCPVEECDSWLTLQNREESIDQILKQSWEFTCRRHGPQRGIPLEAIELAPLGESASRNEPPTYTPVPLSAVPSGNQPRGGKRLSLRVPVVVYGWSKKSGAFHEETETLMVNSSGALVILKTALELGDTAFLVHKRTPTPTAKPVSVSRSTSRLLTFGKERARILASPSLFVSSSKAWIPEAILLCNLPTPSISARRARDWTEWVS